MKKVLAIVLALAMVMMMFVACKKEEQKSSTPAPKPSEPAKSSTEPSAEPSKSEEAPKYGKYNVACVYSENTGDFWGIVANGCNAALDELKAQYGVEGYCVAPATSGDYTQQMDLIDQVLLKKPDGMVLCPSNADSIGTYITDKFTDDSIPIIVIDRSLNSTSPAIIGSYTSDAYSMGEGQAQMAYEALGDQEVLYLDLGLSKDNQNWANRSYGFMDYAKAHYPNFTSHTGEEPYWVSQVTQDICIQYIQDTINSNPDKTILILGTCNSYNNYAITAVSELNEAKKEKVTIIGWDFSATEKGYMESGDMYGAMGQNPYLMGYDSTYFMCDYLAGYGFETCFVPFQSVSIKNIDSDEVKAYMKTMGLI